MNKENNNNNNNQNNLTDDEQDQNRYTSKGPNELDPQDVELKIQNQNLQNYEFDEKETHNINQPQQQQQEFFHHPHQTYEDHGFSRDQLAYATPAPQTFPRIPKKLIFICLVLLCVGFGFLIGGISDYFTADEKLRGILFIVFGGLLFVPGAFYSLQVYLAYRASSPQERAEILQEIPMDMEM